MTSRDETADAWARARAAGPLRTGPGEPTPRGMLRLVEPGGQAIWLVPQVPDNADARVLAELGLPVSKIEQPNDTARVLAVCLRCCWDDPLGSPWPGSATTTDRVLGVFRKIAGSRGDDACQRAVVGALRRLDQTRWVLWNEQSGTGRLGPRVALWGSSDLTALRQVWRTVPAPDSGEPPSEEIPG